MSLANISIVGNLVRPPDVVTFTSGRVKTTLVVAVNTYTKDKGEVADYYKVETWGKLAELAGKYLLKGNQVTVTGRLRMEHWKDKNEIQRVTPVVKAEQLSFPPRLKSVALQDKPAAAQAMMPAMPPQPQSMIPTSMPPQQTGGSMTLAAQAAALRPAPDIEHAVLDSEQQIIAAQFNVGEDEELSLAQAS